MSSCLDCADPTNPTGPPSTAAGVELWTDRLAGAVLAIGNAPTALFRLLELIDEGAAPPVAVLGGSAMAAAAVNAIASDAE